MRKNISFHEEYGSHYTDEEIGLILSKDENFRQHWDYIIILIWEEFNSVKHVYIID